MDINLFNVTSNDSRLLEIYYELIPQKDLVGKCVAAYVALFASCILTQKYSKCPAFIKQAVLCALLNITLAIVIIPVLSLYLPNCLFRVLLGYYFKVYHQNKFKVMAPADVAWAIEKPFQCTNFTSLYVLEGKCNVSDIQSRIQRQLLDKRDELGLVYEKLRYNVIQKFGYLCWKKCENFRIEKHVKLMDESKVEYTEDQVFEGLSSIADIHMSPDKPQWEILIVPKFVYLNDDRMTGNYYAVIFRVHHALMDGVSAGNALRYALADEPMKFSVDPLKGPKISRALRAFIYLKASFLTAPLLYKAMIIRDKNCFNHAVLSGPKTYGWSKPVSMQALKKIREHFKTTTTTLFMNSIGGTIRQLAIKKRLPVPRRIYATPTLAMLPYPDSRPRNRFIIVHYPLETGLSSRVERLETAHKTSKELAKSVEPMVFFFLLKLGGRLPISLAKPILGKLDATIILSNVPGPLEEAYLFGGHKLVDSVFWLPLKNWSGIGAGIFSYAGRARIGFVGDGAALPDRTDVPTLLSGFENEILELGKLAGLSSNEVFWRGEGVNNNK